MANDETEEGAVSPEARRVIGTLGSTNAGTSFITAVCSDGSTWSRCTHEGNGWREQPPVPGSPRDIATESGGIE